MNVDQHGHAAARVARAEGAALADVEGALRQVIGGAPLDVASAPTPPSRVAKVGMVAFLTAAAILVGVIALTTRGSDVGELGGATASRHEGVPRYVGAGFTIGWLPDEFDDLQVTDGGGAHIGLSSPNTDHSIGLSWTVSGANLLDSVNVRDQYDVDLGPNRRATVIETQEQDSQRSQYAIVEELADGTLIKLDTYRVSEKSAIKIATMLSWDRQRGFDGDLNIGGGMTATYLPPGFERIAAWSAAGSTGWPHTIRIVNPTTNAEFVVHRGTPDTLATLGPSLTPPLARRHVDDQNASLRDIFVATEHGNAEVLSAADAQLVVDGLNLSYGWAPGPKAEVRRELASGLVASDVQWSVVGGRCNQPVRAHRRRTGWLDYPQSAATASACDRP